MRAVKLILRKTMNKWVLELLSRAKYRPGQLRYLRLKLTIFNLNFPFCLCRNLMIFLTKFIYFKSIFLSMTNYLCKDHPRVQLYTSWNFSELLVDLLTNLTCSMTHIEKVLKCLLTCRQIWQAQLHSKTKKVTRRGAFGWTNMTKHKILKKIFSCFFVALILVDLLTKLTCYYTHTEFFLNS